MRRTDLHRDEPPVFSFPLVETAAYKALTEVGIPAKRLSMITAATGYGKTVLLSSLYGRYREFGAHCYWVCLGPSDSTSERVISRLELCVSEGQEGYNPSEDMHKSDEPIDQRLDALAQALTFNDGATVLFIDNLDCCNDDTLSGVFDSLILNTANTVYVVLASTSEPEFSLHRLLLADHVARYGYSELAIDQSGVETIFGDTLCRTLGDSGIERVLQVSEGWPAALRMMEIILRDAAQPLDVLRSFSGSDIELARMLNHQILSSFDQAFREFLYSIAPLQSFNVPLCRYVCGDPEVDNYVQRLISNNLLIIPLDRNRFEYRLHSLFREFLLDEGERHLGEDRRTVILQRASAWFEERGRWSEAIDYAIEAGDWSVAVASLERVAVNFVRDRGDLSKFIGWVDQIQKAGCEPGLETDYWYVWALVFHRRYDYAARQLERLGERLNTEGKGEQDEMWRRLAIIRTTCATYTDDMSEVRELSQTWLDGIQDDDPFDVATVACTLGIERSVAFDFLGARDYFGIAQSSIPQANSDYGQAWVTVLSSLVTVYEGDFAICYDRATSALASIRHSAGDRSGMTSTVAALAALAAIETGRDNEAADYLTLSLPRLQTHGILDTALFAIASAVKLWASPLGENINVARLRDIATSFPPRVSLMLECYIIQRMLRLGRVEEAIDEARRAGIDSKRLEQGYNFALDRFLLSQTLIDLDIAVGRMSGLEERLQQEIELAKSQGRAGHLVELSLQQMTVALRSANPQNAPRFLTRAISQAAKRGYIRPFRDRADLIASLVNDTKPKSWGFALSEEREFFNEICKLLPIVKSSTLEELEHLDGEPGLLESPTPRELELLQLIEAGLTNQQLADRLFVSVATVKWHLYNLYNKLGVSNRSSAIAKARSMKLINS